MARAPFAEAPATDEKFAHSLIHQFTHSVKVSVCIITYRQEKYIGAAIEGALMQQTTFPVEILVGDDDSPDNTRAIIRDYAARYPGRVRPVLHEKNLGQFGLFNTLETYKLARGEYIAAIDGDDYWTDPLKLQKQVEFMDAHPDFSACFHNALKTYEDGSPSLVLNPPDQQPVVTIDDLIGEDEIWFMATSSVLFRNVLGEPPAWVLQSKSGDIPRYVLLAKLGPIGYLPDMMSVYRHNRMGVSNTDLYDDAEFLQNRIGMYRGIDAELEYQYHHRLQKNIGRYQYMMLQSRQYRHAYFARFRLTLTYLWTARPNAARLKTVVRDFMLPPALVRAYGAVSVALYRLLHPAETR
jgi:glycosyltransferase involved in cell wall biosynthesis